MIQLGSVLILILTSPARCTQCHNKNNIACPGDLGGCLPPSLVCDGSPTCKGGLDEAEEFCRSWRCSPGLVKCPDNLQCIPERDVCSRAHWRYNRHLGKLCVGGGTNSPHMCSK